jgi:hypothetical protein
MKIKRLISRLIKQPKPATTSASGLAVRTNLRAGIGNDNGINTVNGTNASQLYGN